MTARFALLFAVLLALVAQHDTAASLLRRTENSEVAAEHKPRELQSLGSVSGFVVSNRDNVIRALNDGDAFPASILHEVPLSFFVRMDGKCASVKFDFNGVVSIDNKSSFRLVAPTIDGPGEYTLSATPYSRDDAQGEAGSTFSVTFTIKSMFDAAVEEFVLFSGPTRVGGMSDGDAYPLSVLNQQPVRVWARMSGMEEAGSVAFELNGETTIDNNPNFFAFDMDAPGEYTLLATPYSQDDGRGQPGASRSITFTVAPDGASATLLDANIKDLELFSATGRVGGMADGDGYPASLLESGSLRIFARLGGTDTADSVAFTLNSITTIDSEANHWLLNIDAPGRYTLTATPYSSQRGMSGESTTMRFTIGGDENEMAGDETEMARAQVPLRSLFFVDNLLLFSESGRIGDLLDGNVYPASVLDNGTLRIFARIRGPDEAESVVFELNDKTTIDNHPNFWLPGINAPGTYTFSATPYSQDDGLGTAGESMTLSFTIDAPLSTSRSGAVSGWEDTETLQTPLDNGGADVDMFGYAMAMSGTTMAVGKPRDARAGVGSVEIWTLRNTNWGIQTEIESIESQIGDNFGYTLAMDDNTLVVSSMGDATDTWFKGAVHVYTRHGRVWRYRQTLRASDERRADMFGKSLAVSGNVIVVGAMGDDHSGSAESGSVYLYRRRSMDGLFENEKRVEAGDTSDRANFGCSVALSSDGGLLVVGSRDHRRGNNAGAVYVFEKTRASAYTQAEKITHPAPQDNDFFGWDVAVDGDFIVASAPGANAELGRVFVYESSGGYSLVDTLAASDRSRDRGYAPSFGTSVDIDGNTLVVGAKYADGEAPDSGAAYVFEFESGTWEHKAKLEAADGGARERFGWSVAITASSVGVGAPHGGGGTFAGSAYSFSRS